MGSRPAEDVPHAAQARSCEGNSWLLPAPLMVIAGAWATQAVWRQPDWLLWLALAVVLAALWQLTWSTLTAIPWANLLVAWRGWATGTALPALPYTQPGSEAAYLALRLGQFRTWLSNSVWPHYGSALLFCALSVVVATVLSPVLGTAAVLLSLAALGFTQLGVLTCRGNGKPSTLISGIVTAGLPILLGHLIFESATPLVWVLSLSSVVIYVDVRGQLPLKLGLGFALPAIISAGLRWPASAFALATIWAARWMLKPQGNDYAWLTLAVFVLAAMGG